MRVQANSFHRIDEMFGSVVSREPCNTENDFSLGELNRIYEKELYEMHINNLRVILLSIKNSKGIASTYSVYDIYRLTSIHRYFSMVLEGKKKMEASDTVAENIWQKKTKYMSRCIRNWAKVYILRGNLPEYTQGKYPKRESLLDDEDIKTASCNWLRSVHPIKRTPMLLKLQLQEYILPRKLGARVTVSDRTVTRFMHIWGYSLRKCGQQVF